MSRPKEYKIGIVEDNAYYRKVLEKYLQSLCEQHDYPGLEFKIEAFGSAKEFFEAQPATYQLLLLDYHLEESPDRSSDTAAAIIDAVRSRNQNCRIIVISEQNDVNITAKLFKKGIYDYIRKDDFSGRRGLGLMQQILNNTEV